MTEPRKLSPRITIAGVAAPGRPDMIVSVHVLVDGKPWPPPDMPLGSLALLDADERAVVVAWEAQRLIEDGFFGPPPEQPPPAPAEPAEAGVRFSLEAIRRQAAESVTDPKAGAWAAAKLAEAGNPTSAQGRARAIFEALKREKVWVRDPMSGPHSAPAAAAEEPKTPTIRVITRRIAGVLNTEDVVAIAIDGRLWAMAPEVRTYMNALGPEQRRPAVLVLLEMVGPTGAEGFLWPVESLPTGPVDWGRFNADKPAHPEPKPQHRLPRGYRRAPDPRRDLEAAFLTDPSRFAAGDCDPFAMTGDAELDKLLQNTRAQLDAAMRAGNLDAARTAMAIALAAQKGGAQVVGEAYKPERQLQHVVAGIVGDDGRLHVLDPCAVTRRQVIAARVAIRHSAAPDGTLQFEVLADGKPMHMPKYVTWYLGQLPEAERQPFAVDLLHEAEERDTVDGAYRPDPTVSELSDPGPLEQKALDAWLAHLAAERTAEMMANPIPLGPGDEKKATEDAYDHGVMLRLLAAEDAEKKGGNDGC